MKRSIRFNSLLAAAILAAVAALPLAHAGPPAPAVPGVIAVPDGHKLFLVEHAVGVQIHSCNATSSGYRWDFAGPRADLYDDNGKLLTTHRGSGSPPRRRRRRLTATAADRWTARRVAHRATLSSQDRRVERRPRRA